MNGNVTEAPLPMVTVVIPMRNEGSAIDDCLDAVLAQDYPADRIEVIVVDGQSEDDSAARVRAIAERDRRVTLLENPERIVPTAMNIGIQAARGDVIVRVDGHTRIASDYVRTGVETLRRTGADNVGGPMRPVGGGLFGDAVARVMCSRFGIGAYFHFGTEEREVDTVYMGMWPRRTFERVGLFDEELVRNQDDELNYRLRKAGGRIVINPAMRSWYQNRVTVRRLVNQFYQYGEWKIRVLQKHPRQMSWRHFVPPVFVATLLLLLVLVGIVPKAGSLLAIQCGVYATVLIAATLHCRPPSILAAVATFATFVLIHFSWGAGFLAGLIRFSNRWGRGEKPAPRLDRTMAGAGPAH